VDSSLLSDERGRVKTKISAESPELKTGSFTSSQSPSESRIDETATSASNSSDPTLEPFLAGCIGKDNKLVVISVDVLKGKMLDAAKAYQTMADDPDQTLIDLAVAVEPSAQDCLIGAYIAHCYPGTREAFDKLFGSVLALRERIRNHYYSICSKMLRQYEFFFESKSSTILDWFKLLSGSSAGQTTKKRWELFWFSQHLLSSSMPSYVLPSPGLIEEGRKRYSRLKDSDKAFYEAECTFYGGPESQSKEDFDRRLAIIVLIMTEEEDQPLVKVAKKPPVDANGKPKTVGHVSVVILPRARSQEELDKISQNILAAANEIGLRKCIMDSIDAAQDETKLVNNGVLELPRAIDLLRFTTQNIMSTLHICKEREYRDKKVITRLFMSLLGLRYAIIEKYENTKDTKYAKDVLEEFEKANEVFEKAKKEFDAYDFLFVDFDTIFHYLDCLDNVETVQNLKTSDRQLLKDFIESLSIVVADGRQLPDFMKPNGNIQLALKAMEGGLSIKRFNCQGGDIVDLGTEEYCISRKELEPAAAIGVWTFQL